MTVRRAPHLPRWRDRRAPGVLLTLAAVLLGGAWISRLAPVHEAQPLGSGAASQAAPQPGLGPTPLTDAELRRRFDTAVLLLHAKQFELAADALARVLALAPRLPEAHVNLGFARLGLQQAGAARMAFETALDLKPEQANAYYGLAMSHEALGDFELARGAMRTYLHMARDEDAAHLRRARAALWEWEARRAERAGVKRGSAP